MGCCEMLGAGDGCDVGRVPDGRAVGAAVGAGVGAAVGAGLGAPVGATDVGIGMGTAVGAGSGTGLGAWVGVKVSTEMPPTTIDASDVIFSAPAKVVIED